MLHKAFHHQFRRTTLTLLLCLSFLAGIGWAHFGSAVGISLAAMVAVPALLSLRRRKLLAVIFVVVLSLSFGWWRGSVYMVKLDAYEQYLDTKLTVTAMALQDAAYGKTKQLVFDANDVIVNENGEHLKRKLA